MKKFMTLGLIAMGMFGMTNTSEAQTKIGYLSTDEIIQLMPEAVKADSALNQYSQALYQNANDKQNALNDDVAKFYKDSTSMSAGVKEVKRKDLQTRIQDLSGEEQKIQAALEQKRQELSLPIQKKLQAAIQEVAKENGYVYVFPKEALLVMPPGEDLATLVKKKLNLKGQPSRPVNAAPGKR